MSNSIPAPSARNAICCYPTILIDIWRNKRGEQFVLAQWLVAGRSYA